MEALKFETTVRENGVLRISGLKDYKDQKVEVIVIVKSHKAPKSSVYSIGNFFSEWSGVFPKVDSDDPRFTHIMDRHG